LSSGDTGGQFSICPFDGGDHSGCSSGMAGEVPGQVFGLSVLLAVSPWCLGTACSSPRSPQGLPRNEGTLPPADRPAPRRRWRLHDDAVEHPHSSFAFYVRGENRSAPLTP
jgi:hypothetical protein